MMGYHARARKREQREAEKRDRFKQMEAMAHDDLMRSYEEAYLEANGYPCRVLHVRGWYVVHVQGSKLPRRYRRADIERMLFGLQARASLQQQRASVEHPEYLDTD